MPEETEQGRLERLAKDSWYIIGYAPMTVKYCYRVFERHLVGDSVLEVGPAEGVMTEYLVRTGKRLTLVDGSDVFCADLRRRFPEATVVNCLAEEFQTDERFDNVILGHVLEHVLDPVQVLQHLRRFLSPEGRVFATVPNSRSLHRQAAVLMGLLPREDALNELDIHPGHRRVFHPGTFRAAFLEAGYRIEHSGGYWIKPLSNKQLEATWTLEMMDAFMQLGEQYPDIAAEIYVIAKAR